MTGKVNKQGFSLLEMLMVVAIMGAIAMAAVPVAEISYVKTQETLLEKNLEEVRQAISLWKRDCRKIVFDAVVGNPAIATPSIFFVPDSQFNPPSLEALVKPIPPYIIKNRANEPVAYFYPQPYLYKIPEDPFIGAPEWVVHSASGTDPGTYSAGLTTLPAAHVGVMDISCIASATRRRGFVTAIDGTKYQDW